MARGGALLFWWLLLWAGYRAAEDWGGAGTGGWAVALLSVEPILLGHATLATTDIAFAACLLLFLVVLRRRHGPAPCRWLWPALTMSLAFLSKASALVFVPACALAVESERLWRDGWRPGWSMATWKPLAYSVLDLLAIGLLGGGLVFACCPDVYTVMAYQVQHNWNGHGPTYLMGKVSRRGFWYYYLLALVIKLTLPVLLTLGLLLVCRPRYLCSAAALAAGALLGFSPWFRGQIGVRLILPIVVLVVLAGIIALCRWRREMESVFTRHVLYGWSLLLIVWPFINAWTVWPHGICFSNELWGGTRQGYQYLADSNYDWGQGLPELADWQRREGEPLLHVWYFGTDPKLAQLPMQQIDLSLAGDLDSVRQATQGRLVAVGTSLLCGVAFKTPAAQYLRQVVPVDRTTTFFIYDFRDASDNRSVQATAP